MAQQTGSAQTNDRSPGRVDLVSVFYVAGGIPAIIAFLFLVFAVGVRFCGLPA